MDCRNLQISANINNTQSSNEWLEIADPKNNYNIFFVNLKTGEFVGNLPADVKVEKCNGNQWWELFDPITTRYYYYNAKMQKTVWHRPDTQVIIPLARLQTLKQNTKDSYSFEPKIVKLKTIATQTPTYLSFTNLNSSSFASNDVLNYDISSKNPSFLTCFQNDNNFAVMYSYTHKDAFTGSMYSFSPDENSTLDSDENDAFADDAGITSQKYSSNESFLKAHDSTDCFVEVKSDFQFAFQMPSLISPLFNFQNNFEDFRNSLPVKKVEIFSVESSKKSDNSIEAFIKEYLQIKKKNVFKKNSSLQGLLSFNKNAIKRPVINIEDKGVKKIACGIFKLVQMYMGDRRMKPGMNGNTIAFEIISLGLLKPIIRDELYTQICKQTTDNLKEESLRRGWELMCICLSFFLPSNKFSPYLENYIKKHKGKPCNFLNITNWPVHLQISNYARICSKKLERGILAINKSFIHKLSTDDIIQAKEQIFQPSMFGSTLEEIMDFQKLQFKSMKLPWILTTLSQEILRLSGTCTEGIFRLAIQFIQELFKYSVRVSGDSDEIYAAKISIDQWKIPKSRDAHIPASLLKLWFRELYEPLIPIFMYDECIRYYSDPEICCLLIKKLPTINQIVLLYLIHFLQIFTKEEIVQNTKMNANNLALVMAPNCLRCPSHDPHVIFENARKEIGFMCTLIQYLDTSEMQALI